MGPVAAQYLPARSDADRGSACLVYWPISPVETAAGCGYAAARRAPAPQPAPKGRPRVDHGTRPGAWARCPTAWRPWRDADGYPGAAVRAGRGRGGGHHRSPALAGQRRPATRAGLSHDYRAELVELRSRQYTGHGWTATGSAPALLGRLRTPRTRRCCCWPTRRCWPARPAQRPKGGVNACETRCRWRPATNSPARDRTAPSRSSGRAERSVTASRVEAVFSVARLPLADRGPAPARDVEGGAPPDRGRPDARGRVRNRRAGLGSCATAGRRRSRVPGHAGRPSRRARRAPRARGGQAPASATKAMRRRPAGEE